MDAAGVQGAGTAANPAHLQQKMLRQRHLAIEKQRTAARTRLGAGVIAQANPLVASASVPLKVPGWNALLGDGPVSPSADPKSLSAAALAGVSGSLGTKEHSGKDDKTSGARSMASAAEVDVPKKSFLDDLQEDLAEEILADELPQARLPSEDQAEAAEPRAFQSGASRSFASGGGQHMKLLSPQRREEPGGNRGMTDEMAWGGGMAFGYGAPGRPTAGFAEEVIDDLEPMQDRRPSRSVPGQSRRRLLEDKLDDVPTPQRDAGPGRRAPGPSWNLNVGVTQDLDAAPRRGGDDQRGRKWWKPWQQGAAGGLVDQTEATQICGFTND